MLIWAAIPKWQDVFDFPGFHYISNWPDIFKLPGIEYMHMVIHRLILQYTILVVYKAMIAYF